MLNINPRRCLAPFSCWSWGMPEPGLDSLWKCWVSCHSFSIPGYKQAKQIKMKVIEDDLLNPNEDINTSN